MSRPNEDFRLTGEVFSDAVGIPTMVVIDPFVDPLTGQAWQNACAHPNSWQQLNRMVIQQANLINPNFDWGRFDQRTGVPNYQCDNSETALDGIIDYVVVIYKYFNNGNWNAANVDDLTNLYGEPCLNRNNVNQAGWQGSGGGIDAIGVGAVDVGNGNTITVAAGYTHAVGAGKHNDVFLHEFAHTVYHCPHFFSSNTVSGDYFHQYSSGWGATAQRRVNSCLTGWERWYLGYIEPDDVTQDGTFPLNDFITTGDAIRIEIPNSGGQHLWIENHTGNHDLYSHWEAGRELCPFGETLTNSPSGVYMYIDNITANRGTTGQAAITEDGANGIKFINASGNYDFNIDQNAGSYVNNNNTPMWRMERGLANSISGINPMLDHRGDYDNSGNITFDPDWNGGGDHEQIAINREYVASNDKNLYRNLLADTEIITDYSRSPVFQSGDIVSIGSNPNVFNYPTFTPIGFQPTFLNGLRIEVTSIDEQGNAMLDIKFEETEVDDDIRWTGNIILPEITNNTADLVLAENKQITLDLSGTPNRSTLHPVHQDFFNPTSLTISSGTQLHMKYNSRILVKDRSTLIIEDGAEVLLEDKACIVVEPGGTLHYKGEDITLNGPDAVIILKGTLRTDNNVDFTFKGTGYADIHSTHVLELGDGSDFDIDRLNLPGQGTRFLQLREDTDLHIEDRMLDLKGGQVIYKSNSKISAINADVRFTMTSFVPSEDLGGSVLPIGLEGTNLKGLDIRLSIFEDLGTGVQVDAVETNPILLDNHFTRCDKGLELSQIDELNINGHIFTEQSEFSVKLSDVDDVSFTGTDILHTNRIGVGCELKAVNFAYLTTGSNIDNCNIGIRSEESNVFINNGATISNNMEGIKFVNNPEAIYMLSVGNCRCGNIINNDIGVQGDNIVLDIDAPTHFFSCNSEQQYGNRFDGNNLIFDICYTDPSFPIFNTILARGNFWGGQSISNFPFTITACNIDFNLQINDTEFVTDINDLPNCSSSEPFPTDPQFPSDELEKIKCEKILEGNIVTVHTQSKLAHKDLYDKEYPVAEMKYQPVSDLDRSNDTNDRCVNLINISRCITRALENDRYAALNSYWLDEATRPLPEYQNQIAVYPNPTSGAFTIESKNEEEYFVKIISATGNTVYSSKFVNMLIVDKKDFKKGIYFLEFQQNETGNVSVQKLLIQ